MCSVIPHAACLLVLSLIMNNKEEGCSTLAGSIQRLHSQSAAGLTHDDHKAGFIWQ